MPIAVSNLEDVVTKELRTAPPDGYVKLRRLTYGQVVQRRAMMKMRVEASKNKSFAGEMAMASEEMTAFDFRNCIVEHNLQDVDGRTLNLSNPTDFQKLNPKIGQEIEGYLSELNDISEDDETLGN